MTFDFETAVPWGRSLDEYVRMFALSEQDLETKILDCGGGPASFNAEMTQRGSRVISVDPLYAYSARDIKRRVDEVYPAMVQSMECERERFVWNHLGSPAQVGTLRLAAMQRFLDDYEVGLTQGRYVIGELPSLPFDDDAFDLVLCSHLLFLYSEQLSIEFHQQALREMLRVGRQVRVFPLLDLSGQCSEHLETSTATLEARRMNVQIQDVAYEFQRGGNRMLTASRP